MIAYIQQEFPRHRLFGIRFDVLNMRQAVDWVLQSVAVGRRSATRYVVTPNVSLTLLHQRSAEFREFIHNADLTIVDGMPLVKASRWFGKPLPERVAGSDLVVQLFAAAVPEMPLRVFLLGAASGVADRAAERIHQQWEGVRVVGTCSPNFGFEHDAKQNRAILDTVNAAAPDVLIVGLGAPKQEAWTFHHRHQIQAPVTLCVGGTIDFLAGEQIRAPEWVRSAGVEWMWRLGTNPRRLLKRYLFDALNLPRLFLDEFRDQCPIWCGGRTTETMIEKRTDISNCVKEQRR
ncbi:MAG: WecB/TagA/CpsF family glycosyltransferase [Planctomycetaceae bacterium]